MNFNENHIIAVELLALCTKTVENTTEGKAETMERREGQEGRNEPNGAGR